jgi:hypothetical protein
MRKRMSVEDRIRWESSATYWPTAERQSLLYVYCLCVFEGKQFADEHQFLTMCVALGVTEEEVVAYRARQRLGLGVDR